MCPFSKKLPLTIWINITLFKICLSFGPLSDILMTVDKQHIVNSDFPLFSHSTQEADTPFYSILNFCYGHCLVAATWTNPSPWSNLFMFICLFFLECIVHLWELFITPSCSIELIQLTVTFSLHVRILFRLLRNNKGHFFVVPKKIIMLSDLKET